MKAGPVEIAAVIEPDVGQFLGALVLWRSLGRSPTPSVFRLCIVNRERGTSDLLEICSTVGVECGTAAPRHLNRFLNKWLIFDAFESLRRASHLLLLDWDTVLCRPCPLPDPFKSVVSARRNPSGMYRDIMVQALSSMPATQAVRWGWVRTSINGGVLVGSGESLTRCEQKTIGWAAEIGERAPSAPAWKVEQLALSLAVAEIGLRPLARHWNVTPQADSSVRDRDVCLWHYNDGVEASYLLKRSLAQPSRARRQLGLLGRRWPQAVAVFCTLYDEVVDLKPVARLLSRAALNPTALAVKSLEKPV